jgi:hypothetical protein
MDQCRPLRWPEPPSGVCFTPKREISFATEGAVLTVDHPTPTWTINLFESASVATKTHQDFLSARNVP